ncbi:MAG: diguanylate cyclase, partial [Gallionella sp.]|nr:diguanylate cyclase [Gallionella sp.]
MQARGVGEKVLEALSQPYNLDGNEFHSSSSMGITLFVNYKDKIDELLKQADTAMYEAKKSGRNTLRFFDPAMQEELEVRAQTEVGLREALRNHEFRLYYQMQTSHTGCILGAEVLLRWLHPERGVISRCNSSRLRKKPVSSFRSGNGCWKTPASNSRRGK